MLMRSVQDKYVMSKSKKIGILIGKSILKFQYLQDSKFDLA